MKQQEKENLGSSIIKQIWEAVLAYRNETKHPLKDLSPERQK